MYSFLLKKALPFTLTFVFGAALSALVALFWSDRTSYEVIQVRQFRLEEYGRTRRECRMRRHDLVAVSKPLNILNVPSARLPRGIQGETTAGFVPVNVTFGADGTVQKVEPSTFYTRHDVELPPQPLWDAVVKAARQIQFTPETINSVPVSVEREVEIHLGSE